MADEDAPAAVRRAVAEEAAALRGTAVEALPPALLDLVVRRVELPGGAVRMLRPRTWEQLRHEEGGAGRPVPYWARLWPSGAALAAHLATHPPAAGARVLELGCGLGLPALVAARAGARVLATDGSEDAVACTAATLALNGVEAEVLRADWAADGDALVARGPWDLVLAADVLYTLENARLAARLLPRLLAPGGAVLITDPDRGGARELLAALRSTMHLRTEEVGDVRLHRLVGRAPRRG